MLFSFLNFLGLNENSTKTSQITTQETKESIKEKDIPYKLEDSIPLQKTTTQHITQIEGNTIIEKEIITTQICNGESIKEKTQTNILSTQTFSKGM
ncbi:hypothetical protein LS72_005085 [Helicobacter apodemus]|uniref:Uncharacterized protein n=1 Tax=Helicobacter apodemus TaxID=135569 RepID=A0A4U8UE60_9HELI|nr:hypothetical protein [Helicobacter apodemus]TLE15935.1 hypothetical protein LS72_005085 [Helicobacter apodemus]